MSRHRYTYTSSRMPSGRDAILLAPLLLLLSRRGNHTHLYSLQLMYVRHYFVYSTNLIYKHGATCVSACVHTYELYTKGAYVRVSAKAGVLVCSTPRPAYTNS